MGCLTDQNDAVTLSMSICLPVCPHMLKLHTKYHSNKKEEETKELSKKIKRSKDPKL